MLPLPQSTAYRCLIKAYLSSDHVSDATGKTIAVTISKNGGAFGNPSAGATNATEIANGWYYVDLSTTDTGTAGPLIVRGTAATIDNAETWAVIVKATNGGWTALPDTAVTTNGSLITSGAGTAQLTVASGRANADVTAISTDTTAADSLEALLDGTGANLDVNTLTVNGNSTFTGTTSYGGNVSYGNGIFVAGGSNTHALYLSAAANGDGLKCTGQNAGSGISATGGGTGNGMSLVGGATSGDGLNCSVTSGDEIDANISGNLSGSVGSIAAGGIANTSFAAGAIDSSAIAANAIGSSEFATSAQQAISDTLLGRDCAAGASGTKTVGEALMMSRHRVSISAGVLTVYAQDGVTPVFTMNVTTTAGNPISELAP